VASQVYADIKAHKESAPTSYKTAFITTGAEEKRSPIWVDDNRKGLQEAGFDTFDYTLTGKTPEDIARDLKDVGIIHVNGGSCHWIVKQARSSGFDVWIKQAISRGVIYIGSSGGSIATAPDISNIYRTNEEYPMGLGIAPVHIVPHWNRADRLVKNLEDRLPKLAAEQHKLVLLNDNQFLKIAGGSIQFFDVRG
jgi:dipeptidase E